MQFKSFHWLSYHELKAIMRAHEDELNGSTFIHCNIPFFLQNNFGKIYLYLGVFLIKQSIYPPLLDMR